ncbi:hypothetical protein DERF_003657 [Dermatophagoides farinae]|uniref:Uncharacterized protein n=1 Tax=Dermatophagoides farinae TaxID=6954 RepID=A0A922LBP3_DERFA|nr:hypothetical protein DERF_003657 [Dermatophagoides farinae]
MKTMMTTDDDGDDDYFMYRRGAFNDKNIIFHKHDLMTLSTNQSPIIIIIIFDLMNIQILNVYYLKENAGDNIH